MSGGVTDFYYSDFFAFPFTGCVYRMSDKGFLKSLKKQAG